VKGSKGLAHAEREDLGQSMAEALRRFKASFQGLNWDYMKDREKGELFCDVGISIQGKANEPLVGLWRLDCLEASYGAAGFLYGNIHTVNTFSMFGGLQAKSRTSRLERSHVVSRSSYNLAYEATRQHDNKRNLFDEKEVYTRSPKFHEEINSVLTIYGEKAPNQDYGTRDEFRVGGMALDQMVDFVAEMVCSYIANLKQYLTIFQVNDFLETQPILWISSRVWFGLLRRRLKIAYDIHELLWRKQSVGYGSMSGVYAFVLQSVIFTPPKVNWYVREILATMNYKGLCDKFGMFFIEMEDPHRPWIMDLDINVDEFQVLRELKLKLKRPRYILRDRQDHNDDRQYPLGPTPTHQEIISSLQSNPTVLIPRWEDGLPPEIQHYDDCEEETPTHYASELFVIFTQQLWAILHSDWLSKPNEYIKPKNLEEALKCWSVDFVLQRMVAANFKLHNAALDGGAGRRSTSFFDRRELYFPNKSMENEMNVWRLLGSKGNMGASGYIWDYQRLREKLGTNEQEELFRCLGELLQQCQCLPDSVRNGAVGSIWKVENKKPNIITNSRSYRIRRIGTVSSSKGKTGTRAPAAQRSLKDTTIAFMELIGFSRQIAQQSHRTVKSAAKRDDRRSSKAKRYRKPPQIKPRKEREVRRKDSEWDAAGDEQAVTEFQEDGDDDDEQPGDQKEGYHSNKSSRQDEETGSWYGDDDSEDDEGEGQYDENLTEESGEEFNDKEV